MLGQNPVMLYLTACDTVTQRSRVVLGVSVAYGVLVVWLQRRSFPSIKSFRGDCLLALAGESKVAESNSLFPLVSVTKTRLYLETTV